MIIEESRADRRRRNHEQRPRTTNNARPEEGGSFAGSPAEVAERLVPEVWLEGCDGRHL